MTAENPNAPEPPKAAGSVDSFHPAKVRETTRQFGVAAITYVVISTFIGLWPLLTGGSSEVFDGYTERDVAISFAAFATVLAIWLGVEIYVSQRRWAALVTFLLCLLDTVASGLQVFEPGGLPRYWAPLTLCSFAATYAAFITVKGSRLIAAGKVTEDDETSEATVTAPTTFSQAMQAGWRESRGARRVIRYVGLAAILGTLGAAIYVWGKVQGSEDGVPQAAGQTTMPTETSTSSMAAIHEASPADQVGEAFALAYGTAGSAPVQVGESAYTYTPTEIEGQTGLIQLGERLALVSDGHEDNETGAAQGLVSVHYFQREGQRLQTVGSWPNLSQTGSNGRISGASLRRDLLQNPVLLVRGGGMQQGCGMAFVDLIELTPQAPILRATVQTSYSWTGQDEDGNELPPTELSSTIARAAKGFKVVYMGEVSRTVEYVKRGDKYVPTTPVDDLPGC